MKKLPIILVIVLAVVIAILYWLSGKQPKEFDKRITFSKKESRPYAANVLYKVLASTFPKATIEINKESPVDWYADDTIPGKQVFLVLSKQFNANQSELRQLKTFAEEGNIIFISSEFINEDALDYFALKANSNYNSFYQKEDSVNAHLVLPAFNPTETYFNPGFTTNEYFEFKNDTTKYTILGNNHNNKPNFIEAKVGLGKIILHSDPFLFSNYFALSNNNINYVSSALSAITNQPTKLIWDEFYLYKYNSGNDSNSKGSLRTLLSYPSFAWAFWFCVILGVLYLLVFMKRKQRFVNEVKPLQNDSLAFVQTIGRLYYDNKDHLNLATKMCQYFLEHIRAKYNIQTNKLDEDFVKILSGKSGYPIEKTEKLVSEIRMLHKKIELFENGLIHYYQLFNHFYKNT